MIINESIHEKKYDEYEIVDPNKFIDWIGGLTDSGVRECTDTEVNEAKKLDPDMIETFKRMGYGRLLTKEGYLKSPNDVGIKPAETASNARKGMDSKTFDRLIVSSGVLLGQLLGRTKLLSDFGLREK